MRKKEDQRIFIKECMEISSQMRFICSEAYHGLHNWTKFLEKYTGELVKLQKLFESMGGQKSEINETIKSSE